MRYRFASCELDTATHEVLRDGEAQHVEPQVFDLLRLLVEADGRLVRRDTVVEVVWGGRAVSEATISSRINAARRAVGDTGARQAVIRTVPKRGLQLAVAVEPQPEPRDAAPPAAASVGTVRITTSPDGTALAWCAEGEGPPILRAAHWLSHLELDRISPVWEPLLARLGAGRRLIRYDQRGTGVSARGARDFSPTALAADMEAVIDAADAAPAAIFACSQSAAPALLLAATRPELVRVLVIYGGFARGPLKRDPTSATMARSITEMTRLGWGLAGSAFMKSVAAIFMPNATAEQLADFLRIQIASADPGTAVALREAIGETDVTAHLPAVRCPTLVAHAEGDALHPIAEGLRIASAVPGAEFVALPGNDHVPLPQTAAFGTLMDAVDRFLSRPD